MKRPAIMGIVNVTPDSFSGDGVLADAAIRHAHSLMVDGADILDIGAESTRPNATPLTADEEWERLGPVLEDICARDWREAVRLSVDTRHPQTASRALALGVEFINDVGGLTDLMMAEILEGYECDVIVMHSLSIPANPALTLPPECDVVAEILAWKARITKHAEAHGIAQQRLIYDAGIGFGKTAEQSLALVNAADKLVKTGGRWLFGHSRKSFLKLLVDASPEARDEATVQLSAQLAEAGVNYLRVHNVARHVALLGA